MAGIKFCPQCHCKLRIAAKDESGRCTRCLRVEARKPHACLDCPKMTRNERCKEHARRFRRANRPARVCRKCGLPGVPAGKGYSLHPGCMTRGARRKAVEFHLQNPEEVKRLAALGEPISREDVGCELSLSHESIRQIEVKAFDRFQRHWHVLVELTEQAGLRVDWDWLFGKKTTNDIDLCL